MINGAQPSLESTAISPGILRNRSQKIRCRVNNGWEDKKHKTFARRPALSGSIVQCGSAKHNGCDCYRCCAAAMFEEFVWRIDTLKTQERNHHHEKEETCPDERSFWLLNHAVGDGHVTGCEKALFENFKVGIKKYQEPSCMFICHERHHLIHHLIVRPEVQLFGCSSGSKTLLGGQSHVERRDRWDRLPPGSKLPGCILHFYIFLQYFTSQSSQVSGGSLSLSLTLWICCASLCFFAQDSPKILRTLTSAAQPPGVLSSRHQWTSFVTSRDVTNLSMALWLYVWLRLCPSDFASKHFGCRKSCVFNVSSTCLQRVLRMCSDMFRLFLSVQGVDEGSWIRVSDELYLPKECLGAELETSWIFMISSTFLSTIEQHWYVRQSKTRRKCM